MLEPMRGERALDLEETMREPLAMTCHLPVADRLMDVPSLGNGRDRTNRMKQRPERVIVRPVHERRAPVITPSKEPAEPWRPARARPTPQHVPVVAPRRKITPRANTLSRRAEDRIDLTSLAMFWGGALSGSLLAIGLALASW